MATLKLEVMSTTKICCIVFSLIAIALSVIALCKNVIWVSPSESVLPVIAICTTLIVGMNLVDAITVYRLEQRQEKISKSMEKSMDELSTLKNNVEELRTNANIALGMCWGMSLVTWRPYSAFKNIYKAFIDAIKTDDSNRTKKCLNALVVVNKKIEEAIQSGNIDKAGIDKIPSSVPEEIKELPLYCMVAKELDNIIKRVNELKHKSK